MCGIAGIVGQPDEAGADRVRAMIDVQRHRGPDGDGMSRIQEAILGHCRLAIVGLGDTGRQPMTSQDGRWSTVFNGEVFNYRELRSLLDVEFRTATDTEVLLEASAAWGVERALDHVAGMFAFALWDAKEHELILARDRLGEKPLVYFWDGRTLAFASEMKALEPFHGHVLDSASVDSYLAIGYVPAPLAIFRGCRKLEAGHLLRLRPGGTPRVTRWWFPEKATRAEETSRASRAETLHALMGQAVGQRLRADVPVALCLSGGVDSSVIAAECVRQGAKPEAFTVCFDGEETDLAYARAVAGHLGLRHQVLEARGRDAAEEFQQILWHYDEPFADSSAVPSFALAKALAGRYKVVLNGDGGDEAFAGYRHYEHIGVKQAVKAVAAAVGLRDGAQGGKTGVYVQSKAMFRAAQRARLLNGHGSGNAMDRVLFAPAFAAPARGALHRALWTDRHLHLANGLTYKTDIALGAFGIEGRAPFLDHRLIEWAQWLPAAELVRGEEKKIVLRSAYAAALPPKVLDRPKQGFGAPVTAWLEGPLREMARDALPCPLFDRKEQENWTGQRLWTLVAFSCWARQWKASW
jgi:asparagine synthase (glutamine-hydrolysing)